jgi:hypothetical protein
MHFTKTDGIDTTRDNIKSIYKKIRKYARERNLLRTNFYTLLFDDLYAAYSTNFDDMYLRARIISNGRNQSFRSSSSGRERTRSYGVQRQTAEDTQYEFEVESENDEYTTAPDDIDDISFYSPDNVQNDTNNTQTMYDVIRDVSMS